MTQPRLSAQRDTPCIAVDAMGGDRGPEEVVRGVLDVAAREPWSLLLVGDPSVLRPALRGLTETPAVEIVEAADVIGMDEQPTVAFRRKPDASIVVGARLVKDGRAQALVSIGNTGAAMAVSMLTLGRIKGIDRPAIAAPMPTLEGGRFILLDAGANVDCDPNNLLEFALMGSAYVERVYGNPRPRVGLLSNGEESAKGNDLVKRTHGMLRDAAECLPFEFIGNIEGQDAFRGKADVVVCDGFVGNVFLKTGEGVAEMVLKLIRNELTATAASRLLSAPLAGRLKGLRARLDYSAQGGAPLLGINGITVIGHGRSNAAAVANACRMAARAISADLVNVISGRVAAASAAALAGEMAQNAP